MVTEKELKEAKVTFDWAFPLTFQQAVEQATGENPSGHVVWAYPKAGKWAGISGVPIPVTPEGEWMLRETPDMEEFAYAGPNDICDTSQIPGVEDLEKILEDLEGFDSLCTGDEFYTLPCDRCPVKEACFSAGDWPLEMLVALQATISGGLHEQR